MPFRVTMAALDAKLESQTRSSVFVRVDDIEYVLCSLTPTSIEQQPLNHTFVLGEKITFYTNGENAIHLTGNFLTLDEELDEGYPIDLNSGSEDEDEDELDEEDEEFDSEMDEEITSEEDQDEEDEEEEDDDEEDSCAEFNSEDEDEPKIKELTPEEEKQLVADVNKKIKELKSKRAQSHDDDEEDEEDDEDDISVDENLSFDDDEDDEDDSEFDSEFDEEDFDEDDSEDDSEMESEEEPVVTKNDKRVNPKAPVPEAKKTKVEVKETPKKDAPKQAATATPKQAATVTPKQAATATPQTKDTPKPAAAAQQAKETPKPVTATSAPATKENQVADANKQAPQPGKPVMKTLPSGLMMEDLKVGDGMKVKPGRKVAIVYKGSLTNGKVFDSNKPTNPLEFHVGKGDVVRGLEMGVQGMAMNGTRRITIPAALAYGAKELPGIPKNSTLIFEVTIQSVTGK